MCVCRRHHWNSFLPDPISVTSRNDFILIRAGTGIGVGLALGGEAYRGTGKDCGWLGEFGHMTIVAVALPL
jgi:predicted NBD/HSP70 family sugar kinase